MEPKNVRTPKARHAKTASVLTLRAEKHTAFTREQQVIADLCAEIIVHSGGETDSLRSIVNVVLRYKYERRFGKSPEQSRHVRDVEDQYRTLCRDSIARNPKLSGTELSSEMPALTVARGLMRNDLCGMFQDFLDSASPEEVALMREVIIRWQGIRGRDGDEASTELVQAMSDHVELVRHCFFSVPERHEETVRSFIASILQAETAVEARARRFAPVA